MSRVAIWSAEGSGAKIRSDVIDHLALSISVVLLLAILPREAAALISKTTSELNAYRGLAKSAIVATKDKAWYKNIANMIKSIDGKVCLLADSELKLELEMCRKRLDATVTFTKNYKQWIKKADDSAFKTAWEETARFCAASPQIELELPGQVDCDIQVMMFSAGLLQLLKDNTADKMPERWQIISTRVLSKFVTGEELAGIQTKCIQQIIIDVLTSAPAGTTLNPSDRDMMIRCFVVLFSPFPFDQSQVPKMAFQLSGNLSEQLCQLRMAIDVPKDLSKSHVAEFTEQIIKMERAEESQNLISTFVSCSNGVRLLKFSKDKLSTIQKSLDSGEAWSLLAGAGWRVAGQRGQ